MSAAFNPFFVLTFETACMKADDTKLAAAENRDLTVRRQGRAWSIFHDNEGHTQVINAKHSILFTVASRLSPIATRRL